MVKIYQLVKNLETDTMLTVSKIPKTGCVSELRIFLYNKKLLLLTFLYDILPPSRI